MVFGVLKANRYIPIVLYENNTKTNFPVWLIPINHEDTIFMVKKLKFPYPWSIDNKRRERERFGIHLYFYYYFALKYYIMYIIL